MLENPTVLDFALIGLIVFLGLKGLFNGFFKEVFGIVGLIGGIFLGTRFGSEAGQYINENFLHLDDNKVIVFTGFLATMIIVWLSMNLVSWLLSKITDATGLGAVNKVLGFVFASAKVTLILAVIFHALLSVKVVADFAYEKEDIKNSELLPHLQKVGAYIINVDFSQIKQDIDEKIDDPETSDAIENVVNSLTETVDSASKTIEEEVMNAKETLSDDITETLQEEIDSTLEK